MSKSLKAKGFSIVLHEIQDVLDASLQTRNNAKEPKPKKTPKPKKAPKPKFKVAEPGIPATVLRNAMKSGHHRCALAFDGALDGTGFAMILPLASVEVLRDIMTLLIPAEPAFSDVADGIIFKASQAIATLDGDRIMVSLDGMGGTKNRPDPFSVGAIVRGDDGQLMAYLCGSIRMPSSDIPEWIQAARIRAHASSIIDVFYKYIGDRKAAITIEGMALGGNASMARILAPLGIVYGALWSAMAHHISDIIDLPMSIVHERAKEDHVELYELPIGTWKKAFTGHGACTKDDTAKVLELIGFSRFRKDDQSDALAMAMCAALFTEVCGKQTFGRMRPVPKAK